MVSDVADAVIGEVVYPDGCKAYAGTIAGLELRSQKSQLSWPPLSPKVFFRKLGDAGTFVSHKDGRREQFSFTLLSGPLIPTALGE